MKKIVFCVLPLLLIIFASALNTLIAKNISGAVTDLQTNAPLPGVSVLVKGSQLSTYTDTKGTYKITVPDGDVTLIFSYVGYQRKEVPVGNKATINVQMEASHQALAEVAIRGYSAKSKQAMNVAPSINAHTLHCEIVIPRDLNSDESYAGIIENRFQSAKNNPLSTFGIDVDAASYSNLRRFINNGQLPPKDAVRIEEMINYFSYNYPQPDNDAPFSVNSEISEAPWNPQHRLVKIGLQGKKVNTDKLPPSNLVFLIDVSGSMNQANKLPLLKSSLKMLVGQLRDEDKVSIVVYAGAAGLVLAPTPGDKKQTITDAIEKLSAGGSTAGGEGIKLAYNTARENFIKGGNNRVILATDGDFNVGVSSDSEMQSLIEKQRESGVFLTVLGYGMGNYKDSKMEILANKGNGNYAYIDNINEARKVLVNEFGGTLFTIAKDVKLQVEFNPAKVQMYRLIGYENRLLNKEDFNNDKKDAGDLGAGHTVTALYEVIPTGVKSKFSESVDDLKYQKTKEVDLSNAANGNELFTVKLRYKKPDEDVSKLIVKPVIDERASWAKTSGDFRFAASVAAFGMLLRNSEFKQQTTYEKLISWLKPAIGSDEEGYRKELLNLVKSAQLLSNEPLSSSINK